MIWPRQQRTYGFFGSLFDRWLAYLNAGPLEALATMQAADKCRDTIAQAILFTSPPMPWSVQNDAMFTLPASDAEVAFV